VLPRCGRPRIGLDEQANQSGCGAGETSIVPHFGFGARTRADQQRCQHRHRDYGGPADLEHRYLIPITCRSDDLKATAAQD